MSSANAEVGSPPIFSPDEIRRRWRELFQQDPSFDWIIAPSFWNSYYLSGLPVIQWGRASVTLLHRDGEATLIVPEFEREGAERKSPIEDIRVYTDSEGPALEVATSKVLAALRERKPGVIGIEAIGMPATMYRDLVAGLPAGIEVVDAGAAIDQVRMISSDEEIAYSRLAGTAASAALQTVADLIGPGVEESQLAVQAKLAMERALPAEVQATSAVYMQQGERSIDAHSQAMRVPIRDGEFVEVCCECEVWYYQAGIERAFVIGEPNKEVERLCGVSADAFQAACDAVAPGATFSSVDCAARQTFSDAGYRNGTPGSGLIRNIIHHTGGRIPGGNLQAHNNGTLASGMVLTVEPWTLVPGVGAPRHCDTILVTDTGSEDLTRFQRGMVRI